MDDWKNFIFSPIIKIKSSHSHFIPTFDLVEKMNQPISILYQIQYNSWTIPINLYNSDLRMPNQCNFHHVLFAKDERNSMNTGSPVTVFRLSLVLAVTQGKLN
jgi:hypothetical protein